MNKKYLIFILISFFINNLVYSASTSSGAKSNGREDLSFLSVKNSNYKKGLDALKQAKKYEKKEKFDKSKKRFNDSLKFFTLANEKYPNEPDILNYLGFTSRKVGDFIMAEIYYTQGLAIEPKHIGINEYLGELYVQTNRIELAKERLKILENCNCKEYDDLKQIIAGTKKSKY
jgi:tetratricopeptide (TPR) repeat protein